MSRERLTDTAKSYFNFQKKSKIKVNKSDSFTTRLYGRFISMHVEHIVLNNI